MVDPAAVTVVTTMATLPTEGMTTVATTVATVALPQATMAMAVSLFTLSFLSLEGNQQRASPVSVFAAAVLPRLCHCVHEHNETAQVHVMLLACCLVRDYQHTSSTRTSI